MATIREIAKEAGVSLGTASRALTGNGYVSEENRILVQAAAEKLGYVPKEHSRSKKQTKTVGIILPDVTFPFYGSFLKYAEVELARNGYKTVVCNALGIQNRVSAMLDMLEIGELDGLIFNADVTKAEIARMENLPVVSFERMLGRKIPMVSSDHCQGGRIAAEILMESGCKNVLILTAKHSNQLFGDIRISECQKKLKESGISVTVAEIAGSMLSYRFTNEIVKEYMNLSGGIDGIFTDDVMAYCCTMEAIRRGVRIPEELRIMGYDGNEIIKIVTPRITTVEQNLPELTRKTVELLLKRIRGEETETEVLVPVTYLPGGTV